MQAGLSASISGDFSSSTAHGGDDASTDLTLDELQDRVIQLEQELIDAQEKHDEELEMEKVGWLLFVFGLSYFCCTFCIYTTPLEYSIDILNRGLQFLSWKSPCSSYRLSLIHI